MHQNTSISTVAAKEPAPPDMETAVITAAMADDVKPAAAAGQNRRSVRRYFFCSVTDSGMAFYGQFVLVLQIINTILIYSRL